MRWSLPLFFLLFSACAAISDEPEALAHSAPAKKQKQKISNLKKKLGDAEKEKKKAEEEVEVLREEVYDAELAYIRGQVDSCEEALATLRVKPEKYSQFLAKEHSTLLLKEREMLHEVIQQGPSPSALEAQLMLERIQRLITDLANDKKFL